jgi:hypothetical protein
MCWGAPPLQGKTISYEVDVQGNPFVKLTPTTKNYLLISRQKHALQMRVWTEFKNIPYADAFNNEEQYTVVSLPMQLISKSVSS